MSVFFIVLKTLPFAVWGLYLFGKLPQKDGTFSGYPLITIALAFILFYGGKPYWHIDRGPLSYLAQAQALEERDSSMISPDFSAASFFLGPHLFTANEQTATIFIGVTILLISLLVFSLTVTLSTRLNGLFAQYLFLLCFNYHNQDNLYGPLLPALLLATLGLFLFFHSRVKGWGYGLFFSGLFWGISGAIFPLILIFPLSAFPIIFSRGANTSARQKRFFTLITLVSFGVVFFAGIKFYPEVGYFSGWYRPLNLKVAWLRLQRFVWFDTLLIAIYLAVLFSRYQRSDYFLRYSIQALVLLVVGSLFTSEFDYSQLLLAIPLMVIPIGIWWREVAFDKLSSVIFITVLILSNISMKFIDLF